MIAPSIETLRLYTRPEFDPDTELLAQLTEVRRIDKRRKEDGSDELAVVTAAGAEWLEDAAMRRVIRLNAGGSVDEWMISRIRDNMGATEVEVLCDPLHRILADLGGMEYLESAGGMPKQNLGGINGSISNFLTRFAIPSLEDRDVDWIVPGTIDFTTEQFSHSFDGQTVLALLQHLAKAANGVWRLSRGSNEYEIDVLTELPGSTVWVTQGVNLRRLSRERHREELRTAIRPKGELPPDDTERANIGFNVHPIISVASNTYTVGKHGFLADTTKGPIGEVDQFVGNYLENQAGTREEIVSTTPPRTIEVASAAFVAGDDVSIVKDSNGTLLTELRSPSGLADPDGPGYVQGTVQLPYQGHRNWVRNPNAMQWGVNAPPNTIVGLVNGLHVGVSSIALDNLVLAGGGSANGTVIEGNDVLYEVDGAGASTFLQERIQSDVTIAGGAATVVFANNRTMQDNAVIVIHRIEGRAPLYWDRLPSNAGAPAPHRCTRTAAADVTAQANGAQTNTSHPILDTIVAGTAFEPGWLFNDGETQAWVIGHVTADGGGNAQVPVMGLVTLTDNEAATISKPELGGGSGYAIGHFTHFGSSTTASRLSQDFTVRFVPGITNRLHISVDYVARCLTTGVQFHQTTPNITRPPQLQITDSGGSVLEFADGANWTSAAIGEHRSEILRLDRDITTTTAFKVRVRFPFQDTGGGFANTRPWTWVRFVQVHMGLSATLSQVEGSEANKLFYDGQIVLAAHAQETALYAATTTELGLPADAIDLGYTIRLGVPSMGVTATMLRVVGVSFDPFDLTPEGLIREKQLLLGTAPKYFTDQAGRVITRHFADVNVTTSGGQTARQMVLTSEAPPLEFPQALRFVNPPGSVSDDPPVEPLP